MKEAGETRKRRKKEKIAPRYRNILEQFLHYDKIVSSESSFCGENDRNNFAGMTNGYKHVILYPLKHFTKNK